MASSTILDYALFQLTPTRTRFDLVLFYGGKSEKLASGLFDPFISHLKFAKDQISRGGYSIKLCPPIYGATWFTKSTFERFVRFVSTPAVLERFVSLEKEILQIESSAQANELSNGQLEEGNGLADKSNSRKSNGSSKIKGELEISQCHDALPEENSKIQLQRLLVTRKMLLRKEQAMAYARGLVAGFDVDNMEGLISFADTFGASRLREACINFKELCKKKRGDGLWMEELAAMQACPPPELSFLGTSGIVLNNDATALNSNIVLNLPKGDLLPDGSLDASRSDSTASSEGKKDDNLNANKAPQPMPWPNQIPQYMYNFQNSMPQFPGYPGYPFPIQHIHPQYAMNMKWPPGMKESGTVKKHSEEDEETESNDSESGSDSDSPVQQESRRSSSHRKNHKKSSSKTVVIRNINYITPTRRNGEKSGGSDAEASSSDEDDGSIDEDSLQQQVNEVVGSLEKLHKSNSSNHKKKGSHKSNHIGNNEVTAQDGILSNPSDGGGKTNENWAAFQNLLMKDEETTVNGIERFRPDDIRGEHFMDLESEKVPKQRVAAAAGDSFVVTQRDGGSEDRGRFEDIEVAEKIKPVMKKRDFTDGDLVIPQRIEESGSGFGDILGAAESSIVKLGKGEDWFVANHSGQPETQNLSNDELILSGDRLIAEKSRKSVVIDDSFMIQSHLGADDLYDSQWKTDISMAADLTLSSQPENGFAKENHEVRDSYEPNDLFVVLGRESGLESTRESWSTEYGMDISFMETERRSSNVETNKDSAVKLPSDSDGSIIKKNETNGRKVPGKEVKSKPSPISKVKKPLTSRPIVQKSKLEKEEEIRKKMEELAIQRQKRIAERTAASGLASAATKKIPSESNGSMKLNKNKTHSLTPQTNKASSMKIRAA